MTRRPPMPPDGNIRRAHQRMAPGGRLWSESPVRGPAVRVVAAGDEEPAPTLFWWKFDEPAATGSPATSAEAVGGTPIQWTGGETEAPIQGVPPLSAGLALQMNTGANWYAAGSAWPCAPIAGTITIDVWLAGWDTGADFVESTVLKMWEQPSNKQLRLTRRASSTLGDAWLLEATDSGTTRQNLATILDTAGIPDPGHFVWVVDPAAGTSDLTVNDVPYSSTSGHDIGWTGADSWGIDLGNVYSPTFPAPGTTIDELRITGGG